VMEAVVENVLLRGGGLSTPVQLPLEPERGFQLPLGLETPEVSRLHQAWDAAAEREGRQRAYFSQHGIKPDEVARELEAADPVLGTPDTVRRFLANAAQRFGGSLDPAGKDGVFHLDPGTLRQMLTERGFGEVPVRIVFDRLKDEQALYVGRTHPVVATF